MPAGWRCFVRSPRRDRARRRLPRWGGHPPSAHSLAAGAQRQRIRPAAQASRGGAASQAPTWLLRLEDRGHPRAITMALRRSAPEGVLDLRPGLLEVALGPVTATPGPQAPAAGDTAGGYPGTPLDFFRLVRDLPGDAHRAAFRGSFCGAGASAGTSAAACGWPDRGRHVCAVCRSTMLALLSGARTGGNGRTGRAGGNGRTGR